MAKISYADLIPHEWFGGPLIGLRDGRFKYIFRVRRGLSNEVYDGNQLHEQALYISGFLNESLAIGAHLQVFSLVVPDVDDLLSEHMSLIKTERPLQREIVKERCRTFQALADKGRCVSLQIFIIGTYDPHKRTMLLNGQEQIDPRAFLRQTTFKSPQSDEDSSTVIASALSQITQHQSTLQSMGLELELLDEQHNRLLIQRAQFVDFSQSQEELALDPAQIAVPASPQFGSYTFYRDYIVQRLKVPPNVVPLSEEPSEAVTEQKIVYYACLVPTKTPKYTEPGQLVGLLASAEFTRMSVVSCRPSDESTAVFINTKKNLNDLSSAFAGLLGKNQSTEGSIQSGELRSVEQQIYKEKQHILHLGIIIVVSAANREQLKLRIKSVKDRLSKAKIDVEVGQYCQEDLWFASLPASAHPLPTASRFSCFPIHAAHLLMPVLPWQGSVRPCYLYMNRWRQLVPFDPFGLESSSEFFSGRTRTGKSAQANLQMILAAALGWRTAVIDKLASYHFSVEHVLGGVARKMSPGTFVLNPLEFRVPPGVDFSTLSVPSERISLLKAFFATVMNCEDGLDPSVSAALTVALQMTYQQVLPQGRFPILEDLAQTLRAFKRGEGITEQDEELNSDSGRQAIELLSMVLLDFRSPSSMESQVFNGQSSEAFFDADHLYFDVAPLDKSVRVQALVSQLLAANLDEWVLACPSRHTVLIFDEIWKYLISNTYMAGLMEDAARTYQRFGVSLVLVTQSFNDVLKTKYAEGLFDQIKNRFALPQDNFEKSVQSFDLPSRETVKAMVNSLTIKKGYFSEMVLFCGNETTTIVNYSSPLLYWSSTSDFNLDVPLRDFFIHELGMTPTEAIVHLATLFPHGIPNEQALEAAKNGDFAKVS